MRNERKTYITLLLASALVALPIQQAYADDDTSGLDGAEIVVDMTEVADSLSEVASSQDATNVEISDLQQQIDVLTQTVTEQGEKSDALLSQLQENQKAIEQYSLPGGMADNIKSIEKNVRELNAEPEEVEEQEEPYITLEGIAQLLMLDVAIQAIMLGSTLFSRFWHVLAGGR